MKIELNESSGRSEAQTFYIYLKTQINVATVLNSANFPTLTLRDEPEVEKLRRNNKTSQTDNLERYVTLQLPPVDFP